MDSFVIHGERILFLNQRSVLVEQLIDNGQATLSGDSLTVEVDDLYQFAADESGELDFQVIHQLGLPTVFCGGIHLRSTGALLHERNLNLKVELYDSPHERGEHALLHVHRDGCVLRDVDGSAAFTMPHKLYRLFLTIEALNARPDESRGKDENIRFWGPVRAAAEAVGSSFDTILANEFVAVPSRFMVNVRRTGDNSFEFYPVFFPDNEDGTTPEIEISIEKAYSGLRRPQKVYDLTASDGNRVRVPVPKEYQPQLERLKHEFHNVPEDKTREILENPAAAFDPELVDFEPLLYSERVKGIGAYVPRAFPFISKYKSEWIPGFEVYDNTDGTTRVNLQDEETLKAISQAIADAECSQRDTVEFAGQTISLTDAREILDVAEQQHLDRSRPVEKTRGNRDVLIIKENIFEDEYSDWREVSPHERVFTPVSGFNPDYQLKGYQKLGIAWLQSLFENGARGAFLADDMGLGKTLQVLYFLEYVGHHSSAANSRPAVSAVIVPASVVQNWKDEFHNFFPVSEMCVFVVPDDIRPDALIRVCDMTVVPVLCLMSYETLRNQQLELAKIDWTIVVADEAQKIKNPGAMVTNAVKALKAQFSVALTGTPVENSFFDLWCIFDYAVPGFLGNARQFGERFGIRRNSIVEEADAVGSEIRKAIAPYFLRRVKTDVLADLPPKRDSETNDSDWHFNSLQLERIMPEVQRRVYREVIEEIRLQGSHGKGRRMNDTLRQIQAIRAVSDHPRLMQPDFPEDEQDPHEIIAQSARMQSTLDVLTRVHQQGEKVLVFAELRKTQRMLAEVIGRLFGVRVPVINGDTPTNMRRGRESRQETVNAFNRGTGFAVLVMSPIAAGVGLNITGANHVVHYSRHWNPAKENQATDRAYRIGQTKEVFVYFPKAVHPEFDTFDVVLARLLAQKRRLAASTLYPSEMAEVNPNELVEALLT